jgi:glycosyltransferase involved in cell wall biosynthesis
MHVLIANTLYHPHSFGGAEESVRVLAEELAARGEQVTMVSTSPAFKACQDINGVQSHYVPLANFFWPFDHTARNILQKDLFKMRDMNNPRMLRAFDVILGRTRPDLVHTNNIAGFSPSIWNAARRRPRDAGRRQRRCVRAPFGRDLYPPPEQGGTGRCRSPRSCHLRSASLRLRATHWWRQSH